MLFTRDMDAGSLVREALATDGAGQLGNAGAVYVADVHGMPGPIRRIFAIPRMRERPYPILLDSEGDATASIPAQPGKVTWLRLDGLRLVEIRFLAGAEEVRAALVAPGLPPGE